MVDGFVSGHDVAGAKFNENRGDGLQLRRVHNEFVQHIDYGQRLSTEMNLLASTTTTKMHSSGIRSRRRNNLTFSMSLRFCSTSKWSTNAYGTTELSTFPHPMHSTVPVHPLYSNRQPANGRKTSIHLRFSTNRGIFQLLIHLHHRGQP